MDVSTAHITREDSKRIQADLSNAYSELWGDITRFGWWIWVPPSISPADCDDFLERCNYLGLSEGFKACIRKAQENGCTYVKFDCDAEIYDDLPKYDW